MAHFRPFLRISLRGPATQAPSVSRLSLVRKNGSIATQHNASGQPSRWTRRLIYAGIFGALGVCVGRWMDKKISTPPVPGSPEDKKELQAIQRVFDVGLPIVKELRNNPDYVETDVYGHVTEEAKSHRLTSGPLAGSRGLGLQFFWNDKEKKVVSVVFLGPGLEGWPTMVHGGALGTVIDENLGRAAIRHFPERTGVTANLDISYRAPVYSENFYALHTTLDQERSTHRKAYATCEVRDMAGRLRVEATGLFIIPKNFKLKEVGEYF